MELELLPILLLFSTMPFTLFAFILNEAIIQKEWVQLHKDNGWEL